MFDLQLSRKYACCDKFEFMWEILNLCERFTVCMEFPWARMEEGEELENEWVWSDFSLTTIIIVMRQSFKE